MNENITGFDFVFGDQKNEILNKMNNAADFLLGFISNQDFDITSITDNEKKLKCYAAIFYISRNIAYRYVLKLDIKLIEGKFCTIFTNCLKRLEEKKDEFNFETDFKVDIDTQYCNNILTNQNDYLITLLSFSLYVINIISSDSVKFTRDAFHNSCLDIYLGFLNDDSFLKKASKAEILNFSRNKLNPIHFILLSTNGLTKLYTETVEKWKSSNIIEILTKTIQTDKRFENDALGIIVRIADDKQIETFPEIDKFAKDTCNIIKNFSEDFLSKRFERRMRQIIDEQTKEVRNIEVHCRSFGGVSNNITNTLYHAYCLSINDKMRKNIYYEFGLKDYYKPILFNSNDCEKEYLLKLLVQLSFNLEIAKDMSDNVELMEYLKSINHKNENDHSDIVKSLCEKVIWNSSQSKNKSENIRAESENHIMISYNTGSRDLCLKIKSYLESSGFKVWIDVSDIHGSSLDAMANAVEKSLCVLMCVTEKYRQSVNCQAEAQYAFKLKKPIIPLIMEKGYENVKGWLGIIMGDKIFINFMKYEHEECIRRLTHEINSLKSKLDMKLDVPILTKPLEESIKKVDPIKISLIEEWNETQCELWFKEKNISKNIMDVLLPCDGQFLAQLYDLKIHAPEFYYQSLNANKNLNLKELFHFERNFKFLIQNK